ncbi:sulfite exporter TauE/SafE family protein [Nonomuraea sp. NN258]|uniref:sulfite exporter TauE/SafE family protein n=1 Tax=Nonomuraea antri TaxID=2730852 RepID=UPI0015683C75|nr:sulfite exporter TauE/SafE family protein [Nonomuraea antri]NRQ36597.1 sulfite exporter TauE/SafE family protein [Nonomuraea antri]
MGTRVEPAALLVNGLAAGLAAGTLSCTAVQGGLLAGLTGGRQGDRRGGDPGVVAWFLAGRLGAHAAAGALLGLAGAAVSLPPSFRALLLVASGLMVIVFAFRLLRRRDVACASPVGSARGPSWLRAPLLGAATILVPCGVTISMELLAVSTGDPLGGAAVMTGLVLGSAPAFALLGYVLRRLSRTRLATVAGLAAVAAGLWSVGSGLSLGGWLPDPAPPPAAATTSDGVQTITVWGTRDGYRPVAVAARAGVPVEIVFKAADPGCTRTVTIAGRDVALPATVRLPPQRPGELRYVCGMGMYSGFIKFS